MRRMLTVLAAVALSIMAGCGEMKEKTHREQAQQRWSQMRARVKLQLAERSFDNLALDTARQHCAEVLGLDPECLDAYLLMARINLEQGQISNAEACLDHAASLAADDEHASSTARILHLWGMIDERRGLLDTAADLYGRAYAAAPDNLDYLLTYAQALLRLDLPERALETLEPRLADFEQEAALQLLVGQVLTLLDRPKAAAPFYVQAVRLKSDVPRLREEAAVALLGADRAFEAVEMVRPLLKGEAEHRLSERLVHRLALALLAGEHASEAVRILRDGVELHPESAALWRALAQGYLQTEELPESSRALDRASHLEPDAVETRLLRAYHAFVAGHLADTISITERLLEENPDDAEAEALLHQAVAVSGHTAGADARQHYQRIIAHSPRDE